MNRFPVWRVLILLPVAMVFAAQAGAQAADDLHGLRVTYPKGVPIPTPFPLDARTGRAQTLEFRAPEQMTEADRTLVAGNEAEIARRAGLQGIRLGLGEIESDKGGWGYEQAVCPVFPDHLVLEYSRNSGPGDVSVFAAVIPRRDGHVRVIPVQRRGYSLWTPAPKNALTINDFNHMVKEGQKGLPPDWLTLGLCYAALAGGHVRAALMPMHAADEHYPLFEPATLTVSRKGGADVDFVDVTPHAKAMDWTLTFAQNGQLTKIHHRVAGELVEHPVPGKAQEVKGRPAPYPVATKVNPGQ